MVFHPAYANRKKKTSMSMERYTPLDLLEHLTKANGGPFDLDPCGPVKANPTEGFCLNRYSIEDDGLASPWFGSVFCNPPYQDIPPWLRKARQSVESGDCQRAALLIPYRPNTLWYGREIHLPGLRYMLLSKGVSFRYPDPEDYSRLLTYAGEFREPMQLVLLGDFARIVDYFNGLPREESPVGRTLYGRGFQAAEAEAALAELPKKPAAKPKRQREAEAERREHNKRAREAFEAVHGDAPAAIKTSRGRITEVAVLDEQTEKPLPKGIRVNRDGYVTHINGKPLWQE